MKFVAVAACTSGIAHTYIAREKILDAADIASADFVLLATDIKIGGRERFEGKRIVEVGTATAIQSPTKLLTLIGERIRDER